MKVATVPLQIRVPHGLHAKMIRLIETEGDWTGRQEFVLQAIEEKIEKHRVDLKARVQR